jgi:DNA-binding NtrC family response regulator
LAGYKVVTACDGEEALAIFRADPDSFALVVLDLLMPHMGGEQCYQELLKINPRLRVIIASGYSDESFADDLFENKRTTFVNKPYDSRQFLMAVREALDRG